MVGELAAQCNANDIEDIREKMRVKTGLVIVGGADDQLRLTNRKKKAELVTQAMVDKSTIEQVRSFLTTVLMKQSQAAAEKGKYFTQASNQQLIKLQSVCCRLSAQFIT